MWCWRIGLRVVQGGGHWIILLSVIISVLNLIRAESKEASGGSEGDGVVLKMTHTIQLHSGSVVEVDWHNTGLSWRGSGLEKTRF